MSRNIKSNFKQYNTSYMKTLSKQTIDSQFDINVQSFETNNNFSNKNTIYKTNIYTYANNSNKNKRFPNYKVRIKNNSFKKFTLINNFDNSKRKHKSNLYLFNNNTLNNDSYSFSKYKKRIKAKTKDKLINKNISNVKSGLSLSIKNQTEFNSLNISKNIKLKNKKDKIGNLNNDPNHLLLKKSNTSKRFNIKIQKCYNSKKSKLSKINDYKVKTNINSPLGSDREEKQIIILNHELINKNDEINNLKIRIQQQNKYINELEDKIKNIINDKVKEDADYEQYSKKMIVRNIKVLTDENEELHKQINDYKEKEMKIMKALYYLSKQGISIDSFLQNINNDK